MKIYLCLSNSGKNEKKTEPKNLRKCLRSEYIEENDIYMFGMYKRLFIR